MNTKIIIITVLVLTAGWLIWNYWIKNPEKKNRSLENQEDADAVSRQWAVGSRQSRRDKILVETVNSELLESRRDEILVEGVITPECPETITMANVDRGVDYKKSATHYYLSTSGCGCSDIKNVSEQVYNKFITEHPTGIAIGNLINNYAN